MNKLKIGILLFESKYIAFFYGLENSVFKPSHAYSGYYMTQNWENPATIGTYLEVA